MFYVTLSVSVTLSGKRVLDSESGSRLRKLLDPPESSPATSA